MSLDSRIINVQIALYLNKKLDFPEAYAEKVMSSKLKEFFDKKPTIQQLPDIPEFADAAIVNVEASSEKSLLTVSRARSDLYIIGRDQSPEKIKEEILSKARILYEFLTKEGNLISRMGFVVRTFIDTDNAPVLATKLLSFNPLKIPGGTSHHSSSFKYVTFDTINDLKIHNVTNINVGEDQIKNKKGIALTRDFNMPDSTSKNLNWIDIQRFLETAWNKQNIQDFLNLLNA